MVFAGGGGVRPVISLTLFVVQLLLILFTSWSKAGADSKLYLVLSPYMCHEEGTPLPPLEARVPPKEAKVSTPSLAGRFLERRDMSAISCN